ncbi:MAG: rhodanese-like domain-containing protein [Gammaproteobacteria bacterium]|nr:rhodanese-like domain-containing protein [Gammaproteobacteria bacterium]
MERIPEFIGNHLFLVTLFIAILALLLWNLFGATLTGVAQLEPAEATRMINREGALILDVRPAAEFQEGHVLNAVNIPEAELSSRQKELEKHKDKPVIACCGNGSASTRAVSQLKAGGFEKPYCLRGGLTAWRSAGLPVTRGQA